MRRHWVWLVLVCGLCGLAAQHMQNPPLLARPEESPPISPKSEGESSSETEGLGGSQEGLIVTYLEYAAGRVSVHLQNQGPASLTGSARLKMVVGEVSHDITVVCPREPLQVGTSAPIHLADLGLDPENFVAMFRVDTPAGRSFFEQIAVEEGKVVQSRPAYPDSAAGQGLPDLIIEDVYYDGADYLKVIYRNQGEGMTGSDFLISLRSGETHYGGNHYYRFPVPPPGERRETGGFTLGLVGLSRGDKAGVVAVIDPEGRVRELDRSNNTWKGEVVLRPGRN